MILETMRNALANTCVKYMGQGNPVPDLEFVMHPNKAADAKLEAPIGSGEMVMVGDGSWCFRGVPIRENADQNTWTLAPLAAPNFCESCAMDAATCDCVEPRHIHVKED
ncbi:MAG: hypothetical protein WA790_19350 [Sulfitobacter sp.]